jgi:hypothetical protein
MKIASTYFRVTDENFDAALASCAALDQRAELDVGCETWGILYDGSQRGQMTVWPMDGRGAVCYGGDSFWGDWHEGSRTLRLDSTGDIIDADGRMLDELAA